MCLLLIALNAAAAQARILVVGDSNAVGFEIPAEAAWPMQLMRKLNEPVQVYGGPGNGLALRFPLGIGIDTYATPGPTPSTSLTIGDGPSGEKIIQGMSGLRCAVLALGTNDAGSTASASEIRSAVAAILSPVLAPWICITPPGSNRDATSNGGILMQDVRAAITAACRAHGATVIDGKALLPFGTSTQSDGLHLTIAAQTRLAEAVADAIERTCPSQPTAQHTPQRH